MDMRASRRNYGGDELFGVIAAAIDATLRRHGVAEHLAQCCGLDASAQVRFALGGETVYVPKGRPAADETAAEVFGLSKAEGKSVQEIAHSLGLSMSYVYRLLAREHARLDGIARRSRPQRTTC